MISVLVQDKITGSQNSIQMKIAYETREERINHSVKDLKRIRSSCRGKKLDPLPQPHEQTNTTNSGQIIKVLEENIRDGFYVTR